MSDTWAAACVYAFIFGSWAFGVWVGDFNRRAQIREYRSYLAAMTLSERAARLERYKHNHRLYTAMTTEIW